MSATLTIISWRDIPAQVTARSGRMRSASELSPRFQVAIDRAAMKAGLAGSDAYLEQWRKETSDCGEDLDAEVTAEIERIETAHPQATLDSLVANGGHRQAEEGTNR